MWGEAVCDVAVRGLTAVVAANVESDGKFKDAELSKCDFGSVFPENC